MTRHPECLCASCRRAGECDDRRAATSPIVCCDRYWPANSSPESTSTAAAKNPCDDRPATPVTLCATCRHRDTCPVYREQGGVWSCRFYE